MTHFVRLAVLASLAVALATPAFAEEKLGYIDSASVLRDMPEVLEAEQAIVDLQVALRQEGQNLVQTFQQDLARLQERAASGELTEEQKSEEAARMNDRREKLGEFDGESARKLQEKRAELYAPIYKKLGEAIRAVAKEEGYTFIFNDQNIVYYDEDKDVAPKVRVKLNL